MCQGRVGEARDHDEGERGPWGVWGRSRRNRVPRATSLNDEDEPRLSASPRLTVELGIEQTCVYVCMCVYVHVYVCMCEPSPVYSQTKTVVLQKEGV